MLKRLKEEKSKIEKTEKFLDFKKEHQKAYFYAAFTLYDDIKNAKWQFNYYDPKSNKTTYFEFNDEIKISSEEKIFQKNNEEPKELDLNNIKIDLDKAFSILNELKNEKYKDQHENKFIIVVQYSDDKLVWNITYLTEELNFLNVKIDCINGEILDEKFDSVLRFKTN